MRSGRFSIDVVRLTDAIAALLAYQFSGTRYDCGSKRLLRGFVGCAWRTGSSGGRRIILVVMIDVSGAHRAPYIFRDCLS